MIFLKDDKDFGESDAQNGDCPGVVEASERIGVHLWLHCRLALVHSLVAHNPHTIELLPGLVMCLLSFFSKWWIVPQLTTNIITITVTKKRSQTLSLSHFSHYNFIIIINIPNIFIIIILFVNLRCTWHHLFKVRTLTRKQPGCYRRVSMNVHCGETLTFKPCCWSKVPDWKPGEARLTTAWQCCRYHCTQRQTHFFHSFLQQK